MHPAAPLDGSDSSKRQGTESSEALLISQAASCLAVAFGKNSLPQEQTVSMLQHEHYAQLGNRVAASG